jgi:transportin-3
MAIASLAVQMSWYSILNDVSSTVLTPNPELGPAVLELFRSIPEEADSTRLVMQNEEDLWHYRDVLRRECAVVLGLCEHAVRASHEACHRGHRDNNINSGGASFPPGVVMQTQDVATTEAVLSCLQSWIRIVDMPPSLLEKTVLLPWMFDLLTDSTNGGFEMAVDVVVEMMRSYTSEQITDTNNAALQSPFQKAILEEDEDGMRGYCRIFTEMGESYLSLILSHENMNQEALVELVLRCSNIPDKG